MSASSPITTHVLDVARGRPAPGIVVRLEREGVPLGQSRTDDDGRVSDLLRPEAALQPGVHRLVFEVGDYQEGFYPTVSIDFSVHSTDEHYHVPLLLSPYGYSTYRGS